MWYARTLAHTVHTYVCNESLCISEHWDPALSPHQTSSAPLLPCRMPILLSSYLGQLPREVISEKFFFLLVVESQCLLLFLQ